MSIPRKRKFYVADNDNAWDESKPVQPAIVFAVAEWDAARTFAADQDSKDGRIRSERIVMVSSDKTTIVTFSVRGQISPEMYDATEV